MYKLLSVSCLFACKKCYAKNTANKLKTHSQPTNPSTPHMPKAPKICIALCIALSLALTIVTACAKRGAGSKYSREACPNIFVAEYFSTKTLTDNIRADNIRADNIRADNIRADNIRATNHKLSFTKVTALCKFDKQGLRILNISFGFRLEPEINKSSQKRNLLLPLFAVASNDEKTIFARSAKTLSVKFNARGRAQGKWLLAIPNGSNASPLPSPSPSSPAAANDFSLYLGFEGDDSPFSLRDLLEEKG